jgi:hypothetical protein
MIRVGSFKSLQTVLGKRRFAGGEGYWRVHLGITHNAWQRPFHVALMGERYYLPKW